MSIGQGQGAAAKASAGLLVLGWQARYRPALALVLEQRGRLGGDISQRQRMQIYAGFLERRWGRIQQ
jgi:hypothetical protein